MRVTLRLIASLVVAATLVVFVFTSLQSHQDRLRRERDLQRQSRVLAESLAESVELLLRRGQPEELQALVDRFGGREHLAGIAVFATDGKLLAMTSGLSPNFEIPGAIARQAMQDPEGRGLFQMQGPRRWHLQVVPLTVDEKPRGLLMAVHDADYIDAATLRLWRDNFLRLLLHVVLISFITLLIVRGSFVEPMSSIVEWMRGLRVGDLDGNGHAPPVPAKGLFAPLAREVSQMARSLAHARFAAEEEARLRHANESRWTAERLKEHVRTVLKGRSLVVVSNREPYMHVRQGRQIKWVVPPGGLVTAMEPVLRACSGTWIAQGSGDADRESSDERGRLRVPPDSPLYTLRRVWLTPEEEKGHYYGFANEGLWPLCHIAHTRPVFRPEDWEQYVRVNTKFADVVAEEMDEAGTPYVLIQDYHFALLPRLVKERRPDARIALFWHIPWPNPEAFAITPWAKELLHGMLGADVMGFHIQFHCNNFIETVDRMLESRIDRELFTVNRADHITRVKAFPISIAAPAPTSPPDPAADRDRVFKDLGFQVKWLGVGVDRLDYTKGISERLRAIDRLFEKHPELVEQFTYVELGAPSRMLVKRYQDLDADLDAQVERINQKHQRKNWKPIVFLKKQHSHEDIQPYYRVADACLVTSLHDGMNLVSKEFVAARGDNRGSLILSQFTGASRELREALIVNPYDVDGIADTLYQALMMTPEEQETRMTRMRETLDEYNVYRWAGSLVGALSKVHHESQQPSPIG